LLFGSLVRLFPYIEKKGEFKCLQSCVEKAVYNIGFIMSPASHPGSGSLNSTCDTTAEKPPPAYWKLGVFIAVLGLDMILSCVLLTPLLPNMAAVTSSSYTLYGSLVDLAFLALARLSLAVGGLLVALIRAHPPSQRLDRYHPNGDKKTRDELETEAMEEPVWSWFKRYWKRPSVWGEILALVTQITCVVKCLARMNVEMGTLSDAEPYHPLYWIAVLCTALFSIVEAFALDTNCHRAAQYGKEQLGDPSHLMRRMSSRLSIPLLSAEGNDNDEEQVLINPEDMRGASDITGDSNYKADWHDLLHICSPDTHMIAVAFIFLLLAAIAQVYIPKFLGLILDSLAVAFANHNDHHHESMWDVPGFMYNIRMLVIASLCSAIFAGIRGSIFTIVGARVNVRLRVQLMDSLLAQDIGFFDVTKTGEITSRLSSDTTLVGDQVSLNVNVFLRSLVQAIGVLLFMFIVSWQLSILAFISVPLITLFSKWYGNFVRKLTKLMQKKLADGNSVCEAALGSMSTVRAFDAAESELEEFENCMRQYLKHNVKTAFAYCGYMAFTSALPNLVVAVVGTYTCHRFCAHCRLR
jgi:hypothetical protein